MILDNSGSGFYRFTTRRMSYRARRRRASCIVTRSIILILLQLISADLRESPLRRSRSRFDRGIRWVTSDQTPQSDARTVPPAASYVAYYGVSYFTPRRVPFSATPMENAIAQRGLVTNLRPRARDEERSSSSAVSMRALTPTRFSLL